MSDSTQKKLVVKSALRVVQLDAVQVDTSYQRDVKSRHKRIVSDFNAEAFGVPLVGEREDSSLWIVDGYQRLTAVRKLGHKTMRAEVFNSRGPEHEAAVFSLVNLNRTKLNAAEQYKALLTSGDEEAWRVKECVESCGFKLTYSTHRSHDPSFRYLACINAVRTIVALHGTDPLKFTLDTIRESWPEDRVACDVRIVQGMCLFYTRHEGLIDNEKFLAKMKETTPYKIKYIASQTYIGGGGSGSGGSGYATAISDVIDKLYKRRASRKAK